MLDYFCMPLIFGFANSAAWGVYHFAMSNSCKPQASCTPSFDEPCSGRSGGPGHVPCQVASTLGKLLEPREVQAKTLFASMCEAFQFSAVFQLGNWQRTLCVPLRRKIRYHNCFFNHDK